MSRGLKFEIDTDTIISLLKAENEEAESNTHSIDWKLFATGKIVVQCETEADTEAFLEEAKKRINKLVKYCRDLRKENESLKNDKAELLLAIENGKDDLGKTVDYLDAVINSFTDGKENE